ncbi:2-oxo acid dehydrogenase subunit E2 [Lacticigenium naphthae]|uniref:2-oxo acid dehydrogenase subunit E2 n=1 Tax=Lacticigenium naphthae TaxID=515351 RepID=UPI0004870F28|nr:2-oxo acid dehydrogenase subunit E2 [Lacticigenium naphthae]
MSFEVVLPRQSEKVDESLITFWHVQEGDKVEKGDPLVEVQTEKAVSEVEATKAGFVTKIMKERSETAKAGDVLALISETRETQEDSSESKEALRFEEQTETDDEAAREPKATPKVKKLAKELGVDWKTIPPSEGDTLTAQDVKLFAKEAKGTPKEDISSGSIVKDKASAEESEILATPSVRKFAREKNVQLEEVASAGSSKKISKEDVEAFIAERTLESADKVKGATKMAEQADDSRQEIVPLTSIRKVIARSMKRSISTIPHVTHFEEANAEKMVTMREELKGSFEEENVKLTYLAFVVKAMVKTLQKYPYLNGSFDEENEQMILNKDHHISIAVNTEEGLLVPVIKHADQKSLFQIAKEIQELAAKAREGTVTADEMSGGTATISNVGSARGSFFTPIINPPQAVILGIGRIEKKTVVIGEAIAIKPMMALSLSYDHRLIDGILAQEALNELKNSLANPSLLLAKS